MKQEFYYPSGDGQTKIHGIVWRPETDVKAVLQICHGMVEYIDRYNDFAQYLAERGVCVVGHDHLGHGKSVQSEEYLGFFHESHGNKYVITDIHRLRRMTEKDYAGVPYFMMGHSMGSFLLRQYLTMRAEGLAGAIIMGTGHMPHGLLAAGQMVCRTIAAVKGWQYRSEFMNQLGMGGYNKQFEPSESTKDWITSDEEMRKKYEADPLCSFTFTVNGYYQMFEGMKVLTKKNAMDKIPGSLPVLFVSGAEDPVGSNGEGVARVFRKYERAGIQDVKMKLYPQSRHEILNESNREQVYEDLYQWMDDRI
ncbi:MAG: alpha/beta hydrolase [Dorea sp.]|jgi:alpha-beta hydrolase superfamily lysophospholipase|nr:alpha/beta hydrolase [Dorea sp.]